MDNTSNHPVSGKTFTPRSMVLVAIIAGAVGVRLFMHFFPGVLPWNFSPVLAVALFGGACFSDRRVAMVVPLAIMFMADLVIGLHSMMPLIYLCLAATVLLGSGVLRGRLGVLRVALAAVGSATGFYLVTNFAVWLSSGMYPLTGAGLMASYAAGLPFYEYGSLPGTLLWSTVLFGGFALLTHRFPALDARLQAA
ncbi:MAG: DUF6580 family putative transport protein [Rhodanobacteraceae bacterium]